MNLLNLLSNNGRYPLSADALDMMQGQSKLLQNLSRIYGNNFILVQSTATTNGVCVVNGEVLELRGAPNQYLKVYSQDVDIAAGGETFTAARTIRYAQYTSVYDNTVLRCYGSFDDSIFPINDVATLLGRFNASKKHFVPKGTIIMWSGAASYSAVPVGYVPCGYCLSPAEANTYKARYNISDGDIATDGPGRKYLKKVNGVNVPELSGRFVIGAGDEKEAPYEHYDVGETGGQKRVTLTESEMPRHSHEQNLWKEGNGTWKSGGNNSSPESVSWHNQTQQFGNTGERGGSLSHENRPPYYALLFLIKVTDID